MTITAAELVVKVGADVSDAEGGLKSFSGKMKNMAGSMGAVGGVLTAAVTAPLVGIAVSAVKTAADFERSMNVLGYASGATADQMQALSDQALQLGADTVFSANEAAEGMVELSKAGMDVTDVMDAIPGVMDLAAAGQISVSEAASLAAATVNTFGLEASKTTEVADILAAAANASAADITDLAFGVQNAGSVFATSGQSVETLATMMALLANNGLNASDAATSLKTMTMRLTAPTAGAAKAMKQLGIQVFNADGSMRSYHDIIGDIEHATLGLSDAQRSAAFTTIFGADAIRAANIMAAEGTAGYEAMATAVSEQGAAAAMANAQNSGLAGAMEQISGSVESLMTKLALPFLPTISGWIGGVTEFVNSLGTLSPEVVNATLAFGGFAAAIGLVMVAAAGVIGIIGVLGTTAGVVAAAVLGLGAAAAVAWVAWEQNWGNIQGIMQPVTEAFTTTRMAIEDFVKYLIQASAEGDVFNTWLLSVPPAFVPFAEAVAGAMIAVRSLGRQLSNLGQYLLEVALKGTALNIWLFTMTPALADFALALGNGIIAVQNFAAGVSAAFAETKFPTFDELFADLLAGDFGSLTSKLQAALDRLVLNLKVKLTPEAPTAPMGKIADPKFDTKAWADIPARMISSLTTTIKGGDWEGAGESTGSFVGERMKAQIQAEIQKVMLTIAIGQAAAGFVTSMDTFSHQVVDALVQFGADLHATGLPAKIAQMSAELTAQIGNWFDGFIKGITGAFAAEDATSTSDILRERQLGPEVSWSDYIPKIDWSSFVTSLTWGDFITAIAWANFVVSLSWASFVTALSWSQFISNLGWNSYVPELSWSAWIPHLDWSRFVSWLTIPSGGGGGGGGIGGQPEHLNDPRPQAMGTSYWTGGTALVGEHGPELVRLPQGSSIYSNQDSLAMMAGGVTINVNVASINSQLDIEQLAAQLARRFQQKLRL